MVKEIVELDDIVKEIANQIGDVLAQNGIRFFVAIEDSDSITSTGNMELEELSFFLGELSQSTRTEEKEDGNDTYH